jgi:CubicO group peptidase (beta-lactamase class C family)
MSALPRSTPEEQGIPSAAISTFINALEREIDSVHSFVLVRHGYIVAEGWWRPYQPTDPHVLFSLSKSFTSTAIGLLVAEGKLSVNDSVLGFFPEEAPTEPSVHLQAMQVRHLLSMSTGHATEPVTTSEGGSGRTWVEIILAHPVEYAPGTHWLYNSMATYLLSAIVQRLTGGRMLDYLRPRLFEPLGISDASWQLSPQGIDTGGWGLSIPTEGIAAFGQMYLQKGMWQGLRILPEAWIEEATSVHIDNAPAGNPEWEQGYGYQFWRCRHNAYRGDGAFGQYCVVMPEQDAVLAITSGLGDMQPPLNLVWEHLLPAMGSTPLPDNESARTLLTEQLSTLELPHPQGMPTSAIASQVAGQLFKLDTNVDRISAVGFDFSPEQCVIRLLNEQGERHIHSGYDRWLYSSLMFPPLDVSMRYGGYDPAKLWKIAGSGAWTDEFTYTAKLWWVETPFAVTLTCHFAQNRLTITQRCNVGFGPLDGETLMGQQTEPAL